MNGKYLYVVAAEWEKIKLRYPISNSQGVLYYINSCFQQSDHKIWFYGRILLPAESANRITACSLTKAYYKELSFYDDIQSILIDHFEIFV